MKKMLIIGMALLIMVITSGCGIGLFTDDEEITIEEMDRIIEEMTENPTEYTWIY